MYQAGADDRYNQKAALPILERPQPIDEIHNCDPSSVLCQAGFKNPAISLTS